MEYYIDPDSMDPNGRQEDPHTVYHHHQQQQQRQPTQQKSSGVTFPETTISNSPCVPPNGAYQYGAIPRGIGFHTPINSGVPPSAFQPQSYVVDRWETASAPFVPGNIAQPSQSYPFEHQFDGQSIYAPETNYANSYDGNYETQQHSGTPSINFSSENAHKHFRDSGLGTGFGPQPESSTNVFGSPTSSNSTFPFPQLPNAQQCLQMFSHPPATPQGQNPYLQVPSPSPLRCSHCGHNSGTQSEHKKHMARHEKPHKCPLPSCDYASATVNDLERHTISKHRPSSQDGKPVKVHVCTLEPCKSQDRKFPRLDNFRNHLRKRHNLSEDVVQQLVRSSRQSVQSSRLRHRRESTSFRRHSVTNENDIVLPYSNSNTQMWLGHVGGVEYGYPQRTVTFPPPVLDIEESTVQAFSSGSVGPQTQLGTTMGWTPIESSMMESASFRRRLPQLRIPATPSSFSQMADTPIRSERGSEAGSPYSMGEVEHSRLVLENAGYEVKLKSQPGTPNEAQSRRGPRRNQPLKPHHPKAYDSTCERCRELKDKPSELRKHINRKRDMFFCTSGCKVTFGGKDEWRRHENCTHWMFEKWKCTVEGPSGESCPYASYHFDPFKRHLTTKHTDFVAEHGLHPHRFKVFDGDFPTTFWCGFCTYCVEMTGICDANQRVIGRLNHIEDHLKGRNQWPQRTAEDWVPEPEGGCHISKPLDCGQHKNSRSARHRSRSGPGPVHMEKASINMAAGVPEISITPVLQQAQAAIQPQLLDEAPQASGSRSRSSSSPNAFGRPRRRTTTRICCNCESWYFEPNTYDYCVNCQHKIEGCESCTTKKIHVPQGNEERYG